MSIGIYYSTGLADLINERKEHIFKHHRTIEHDVEQNTDRQLTHSALMLLAADYEEGIDSASYPEGWDHDKCNHMLAKPYRARLVIAAALLLAEIDRIDND